MELKAEPDELISTDVLFNMQCGRVWIGHAVAYRRLYVEVFPVNQMSVRVLTRYDEGKMCVSPKRSAIIKSFPLPLSFYLAVFGRLVG